MTGMPCESEPVAHDACASTLAYLHGLLCKPPEEQDTLAGLLSGLLQAFRAPTAGVAAPPEYTLLQRVGEQLLTPARWPWETDAGLAARVQQAPTALTVPRPSSGSFLLTSIAVPQQPGWLLWLEDDRRNDWTVAEAGALTLAGQVLSRWLVSGEVATRWVAEINREAQQRRLETAALVARRLAHDYGNIFTGVLGFTELSMGHPSPSSALVQSYLSEVYRSAQTGARLTHQLRLFSRRQFLNPAPSSFPAALEELSRRLAGDPGLASRVRLDVPANLPLLAMDTEHVRHWFEHLLDNALEATTSKGTVTVSARAVSLAPDDCTAYWGELRPGPHVAINISDTGPGLSIEARQRVLVEPFYTSKPRHRGLGLAVAYGVLRAHHGGLRLVPGDSSGLVVQVLVPAAATTPLAADTQVMAVSPSGGEKVLVVDDDPLVLQFVRTTLERAGYRVQAVTNAEEALTSYAAAQPEPFRLVLSDILMPQVTGVDLARSLHQRDANVRVLFMSGHPSQELVRQGFAGQHFELLAKPFPPEGLLRAVRSAIERPALCEHSPR